MQKVAILFDIDGTLLLDGGASHLAFDRAFLDLYQVENASIDVFKSGRTDFAITQDAAQKRLGRELSSAELATFNQIYVGYLTATLSDYDKFKVLPGVSSLLERLSRSNILLGLQTGNIEGAAHAKLARGAIDSYFSFGGFCMQSTERATVVNAAMGRLRKAHPELPNSAVFLVGDTPFDVQAGKQAGIHTISVCTGKFTREQLATASPSYIMDSLEDTEAFFRIIR